MGTVIPSHPKAMSPAMSPATTMATVAANAKRALTLSLAPRSRGLGNGRTSM